MRDGDGMIMRDTQGKVIIVQVQENCTGTRKLHRPVQESRFKFLSLPKTFHLQVFPKLSKEFAFYYKLLYYTILESMVKLVIPLAILIYTNLSIYRLVNKENPFVSSWL